MALYNHTTRLFADGAVSIADIKVMLVDNTYTFSAAHANISSVTGGTSAEVSGNGWTAGGMTPANLAVTTVTTDDAMLDGDDLGPTATGGNIGPAYGLVVYDSDSGNVLKYHNFGGPKTADEGEPFNVRWDAAGIINWTYTA